MAAIKASIISGGVPGLTPPPADRIKPRPPVFSRVTGATLHMDSPRAERFAEVLTVLGYAKDENDTGMHLSAHGFTLNILPESTGPDGYRISRLRLAMARPSVAPI